MGISLEFENRVVTESLHFEDGGADGAITHFEAVRVDH